MIIMGLQAEYTLLQTGDEDPGDLYHLMMGYTVDIEQCLMILMIKKII